MSDIKQNAEAILQQVTMETTKQHIGKLKIFFGYSAGVGKTYAMLEAALSLLESGEDVIIGYVEPHQRPATVALAEKLPQIPPKPIAVNSAVLYELDIDSVLMRMPKVVLIDELAHTNAKGSRHAKRYQDVEEVLHAGIDVYTTINVQHIEGLNDVVEAITGIAVRERVPDSIFDSADKVELVDIEPEDLVRRLLDGKIYKEGQAKQALHNFFTKENLVALREIALRRTADRVNISVERYKSIAQNSAFFTGEHILMCLSSSPSNAKVVRTAAKMAEAFHGTFTALFVETTDFAEMSEENKNTLRKNLRLAEQLGARITTVYGDDIAYQVAEYAKLSGVSKIVLGRPVRKSYLGFSSSTYVDKLTQYAPDLEIYVIPNKLTATFKDSQKKTGGLALPKIMISDTLNLVLCLSLATVIGFLFDYIGFAESNIITVYILATLFIAMRTTGRIYGLASSLLAVLLFNFFFTDPRHSFNAYDDGYPVTFAIMLISALTTSTIMKRVKDGEKQSSLKAFRTEVLLETSQKLSAAKGKDSIILETVNQIKKLLGRPAFAYSVVNQTLSTALCEEVAKPCLVPDEFAVAQWVLANNKHAGATTNTLSGARCLYMSVRSGDTVSSVIGIDMMGEKRIDSFEKSLLIAVLAESGMALEKERIQAEHHEMKLKANTEQLRSNLLRAISHDLRTPLTSISGGSDFILENMDTLDHETLKNTLTDISNEAKWLSSLVENLLNMTRIQDGRLSINKKPELVDEVVLAAVSKINKRTDGRKISVSNSDCTEFVQMDAQLIIQVIINLIDNAINHTRPGSVIEVSYRTEHKQLLLSVSDNGGGIPSENMEKLFDLFYTTAYGSGDKKRGMGLGLSICKSITEAHGGIISATNNDNGGATFTVTLPVE